MAIEDGVAADIATAAYGVYRRYRRWAPYAPLYATVCRWVDTHPEITAEPPRRLQGRLRAVAERHARDAKAAKSGYRPEDEAYYSLTMIRELLPYALNRGAIPPPTLADEAKINRHHAGKVGYGGWEVSVADIRAGMKPWSSFERAMMTLRHCGGMSVGWLARELGWHVDALQTKINRLERGVQRRLGGPPPQPA